MRRFSAYPKLGLIVGARQPALSADAAKKPNPPRQRYLTLPEVIRLIEAAPKGPVRALEALIHGTGMEASAALALTRADVDVAAKSVHAHGTKTRHRDRVCMVAMWAWPYVERHISTLLPGAKLFPGLDRWTARDAHVAACKKAKPKITDYRLHDARHTYAVTAIKAGAPFEVVDARLGHGSTQMVVNVYGRYRPNAEERRAWESNLKLDSKKAAKA